jgi:hypothetical protein
MTANPAHPAPATTPECGATATAAASSEPHLAHRPTTALYLMITPTAGGNILTAHLVATDNDVVQVTARAEAVGAAVAVVLPLLHDFRPRP